MRVGDRHHSVQPGDDLLAAARAAAAELLPGAALTAGSWQVSADAEGPLACEAVVTRIGADTVGVHVGVAGMGHAAVTARAASTVDRNRDFCTRAWGALLAEALAGNAEFREGSGDFDGSIGLRAGAHRVELKVYRGTVLEVTGRTPHGPTFALSGDEIAWVGLAGAARNDYIPRSMRGEFGMSGDSYEYIRRTKAVVALWDTIQELYRRDA
jgi:hypothetical protein